MAEQIFKDLSYAPYQSQYVAAPNDVLAALGNTLEEKYTKNKAAQDTLDADFAKIPGIDKDIPLRNSIIKSYQDQLKNIVDNSHGAYEKLGPYIDQLGKKFINDVNYGQLGAISKRYSDATEYGKQLEANKEVNADTKQKAFKYAMDTTPELSSENSKNGIYPHFNKWGVAKDIDVDKKLNDLIEGIKADTTKTLPVKVQLPDGTVVWQDKKVSEVKDSDVYNYAMEALKDDPDYKAFANRELTLKKHFESRDINNYNKSFINQLKEKGASDEQAMDYLDEYNLRNNPSKRAATKYGFKDIEYNQEFDKAWEKGLDNKSPAGPEQPLTGTAPGIKTQQFANYDDFKKTQENIKQNIDSLTSTISNPNATNIQKEQAATQKFMLEQQMKNNDNLVQQIDEKYKSKGIDINSIKDKVAQYKQSQMNNLITNGKLIPIDKLVKDGQIQDNGDGTYHYNKTVSKDGLIDVAFDKLLPRRLIPVNHNGINYLTPTDEQSLGPNSAKAIEINANNMLSDKEKEQLQTYNKELANQSQNNTFSPGRVNLLETPKSVVKKSYDPVKVRLSEDLNKNPENYTIYDSQGKQINLSEKGAKEALQHVKVSDITSDNVPGYGRMFIGYSDAEGKDGDAKATGNKVENRKTYYIAPKNSNSNVMNLVAHEYETFGDDTSKALAKQIREENIANETSKLSYGDTKKLLVPLYVKKPDNTVALQNIEIQKVQSPGVNDTYVATSPITGKKREFGSIQELNDGLKQLQDAYLTK